ncbi:MAG: hypothetical protein IJ880_02280 [Bacilli bacterium]|nr:hypothetical protein [Bacilli bacterium]
MNNKVLIQLLVPEIDFDFDIFIPVNEQIWKIKKLIIKSIGDMTGIDISNEGEITLINKKTLKVYNNNDVVIDTDIRNATELVALPSTKM